MLLLGIFVEVMAGRIVQGCVQGETNDFYSFIDMNVEEVGNKRRSATQREWCSELPINVIIYVILKMSVTVLQEHNWEVRITCGSRTKH